MHHHQQALRNCAGANNLDTNLRFVYSVHLLFVHVTQVGTWWEYARCNMYTQYIGIVDWWQKICKKNPTCMQLCNDIATLVHIWVQTEQVPG